MDWFAYNQIVCVEMSVVDVEAMDLLGSNRGV